MKILIADDHAMFRRGMILLLSHIYDDVSVVEASTAEEALDRADGSEGVDLALLDLKMPGMDGFTGLRRLREQHIDLPIAILSMSEDVTDISAAIEYGANGYILKSADEDILKAAISLIMKGQVFVPSHALTLNPRNMPTVPPRRPASPMDRLTRREKEVLEQLMKGRSNKEIADELDVLEGTVKKHVHSVLKKLGAANRTQAVITATRMGWPDN